LVLQRKLSKSEVLYTDYISSINITADDHELCHSRGLCTVEAHNDFKSHKNINNKHKSRDSHLLHKQDLNHVIVLATINHNAIFGRSTKSCYLRLLDTDQVLIAKVNHINKLYSGDAKSKIQVRYSYYEFILFILCLYTSI